LRSHGLTNLGGLTSATIELQSYNFKANKQYFKALYNMIFNKKMTFITLFNQNAHISNNYDR